MTNNPGWWPDYSWKIGVAWITASSKTTLARVEFDSNTSRAYARTWFQIANIPGYLITREERRIAPLLEGFDISAISVSNIKVLQWVEDYVSDKVYYNVYIEAPAYLLSQSDDSCSVMLEFLPPYQHDVPNVEREIHIFMLPNTEVVSASPAYLSSHSGHAADFTLNIGDPYPKSLSVTSGPPKKDATQVILENLGLWAANPSTWVAFGTLIALAYTGFRGKRLWGRRKTYYRLYRSMVKIYDHYSNDFPKLHQEIDDLSKAITEYFVEDKITDDQFDKLLTRCDDLVERARKLQDKN